MPAAGFVIIPERVLAHAWTRVERGLPDECWPSSWSVASHGYPQIGWQEGGVRYLTLVHRVVWTSIHGQIPEGLTVDHRCHNRRCANPTHLRLLTNTDNARDNGQITKTHCPRGHAYAGSNLIIRPNGHRICRACQAFHNAKRKAA